MFQCWDNETILSLWHVSFSSSYKVVAVQCGANLFNTLMSGIQSSLRGRRVLLMLPNVSGSHSNWKSFQRFHTQTRTSSSSVAAEWFMNFYDFCVMLCYGTNIVWGAVMSQRNCKSYTQTRKTSYYIKVTISEKLEKVVQQANAITSGKKD